MAIQTDRLRDDFAAIANITRTPGNGATRPTFTPEWAASVEYVAKQAEAAGCAVRRDACGNVFARPLALAADERAWLVGSHLDTVPHGGTYDGVAGVLVGLELLRSAREDGVVVPVELVIFAEEEGPTFGLGMLGSRALVGELDADKLSQLRNNDGQSYLEAGKPHGVDGGCLSRDKLDPARYLGLIELHAEQGPGMWKRDERLALVTAIAGRRQYEVVVTGEANHAGATGMNDRRDALAGAAEMVVALEKIAPTLSAEAVVTVGKFDVEPNAVNVIANRVRFTVDFRAPADEQLARGDAVIGHELRQIGERRGLGVEVRQTEEIAARPMYEKLIAAFGSDLPRATSGALHDAAVLAPHVPTVMLFVPSEGGISHNPREFSRVEDVGAGCERVEQLVRRPTIGRASAMDRDAFVATFGGLFEKTPWIAEKAWERRPFASPGELLSAMTQAIADAEEADRVALIRAHPDLVGRLAGRAHLTAESQREQQAAGLDELTAEQAETLDCYNAAYREKFAFPFVICARENKVEAILAALPERLKNDRPAEVRTALAEIEKIARLRLSDLLIDF